MNVSNRAGRRHDFLFEDAISAAAALAAEECALEWMLRRDGLFWMRAALNDTHQRHEPDNHSDGNDGWPHKAPRKRDMRLGDLQQLS